MGNKWFKYTDDRRGMQELVNSAFCYMDENPEDYVACDIIDGLLDLCALYIQGLDYPEEEEEEEEEEITAPSSGAATAEHTLLGAVKSTQYKDTSHRLSTSRRITRPRHRR